MDSSTTQEHKSFVKKIKGRGAKKKELAVKKKRELDSEPNRGRNPKAFTRPSDGTRKALATKRKVEQRENRLRLPNIDLSYTKTSPPPLVIAVVGPPRSGKSTLIRSLIKALTQKKVQRVNGPITMCGKNDSQRVTFLECPATLNAMCDVSKIADIVVMVIDSSFGFELETFEFLNIATVHGLPRIVGILTHLDNMKNNKTLKKSKKIMRHRFAQEVSQGAKLFYLTGREKSGLYKRSEMLTLQHYLHSVKATNVTWKGSHPYLLADRYEDITNNDESDASDSNRTVAFYGYVRGKPLLPRQSVHLPGVGDYPVAHIMPLKDPCRTMKKSTTRSLTGRSGRSVYAPQCDLGELSYQQDGVFVHMEPPSQASPLSNEATVESGISLIQELRDLKAETFSHAGKMSNLSRESSVKNGFVHHENNLYLRETDIALEVETNNTSMYSDLDCTKLIPFTGQPTTKTTWDDPEKIGSIRNLFITGRWEESDLSKGLLEGKPSEEGSLEKGYESMDSEDTEDSKNMQSDTDSDSSNAANDEEGNYTHQNRNESSTLRKRKHAILQGDEEAHSLVQHFLNSSSVDKPLVQSESPIETQNSLQITAGLSNVPPGMSADYFERKKRQKLQFLDSLSSTRSPNLDDGEDEAQEANVTKGPQTHLSQLENQAKKQHEYANQVLERIAPDENSRVNILGYLPGMYVRVVLRNLPVESLNTLRQSINAPVILGGLLPGEDTLGLIHARVKRHRWHKGLGKSYDPVVFSMGWRRFQTQPIYAMEDPTGRQRFLKYTPQHMHCVASFYGPQVPPNTGICALRLPRQDDSESIETKRPRFRLTLSGYTMEIATTSRIVKKLKIVGYPHKISKNTVFVKDMFSSSSEAVRFEGAKLRTVSGIRGAIKKAVATQDGMVRCSFEDKLLRSDIIFLRAFTPVEPPQYYNPVTNLCEVGGQWKGMRTTRELCIATGSSIPKNPDSEYLENPVHKEASEHHFSVPKALAKQLPYSHKESRTNPKANIVVGIPKDIRSEVAELATVFQDRKESQKMSVLEHFDTTRRKMEATDEKAAKKRLLETEKKTRKDELHQAQRVKKYKKETAKKLDFRKGSKRG